jgi:hypothetical protein
MNISKKIAIVGFGLALALVATPGKASELTFPSFVTEPGFIPALERETGADCTRNHAWAGNTLIIVSCGSPAGLFAVERDGSIWRYGTPEDIGARFGKAIGYHFAGNSADLVLEFDGALSNLPLTIVH